MAVVVTAAEAAAWAGTTADAAGVVDVLAYATEAITTAGDGATVPPSAERLALLTVFADLWEQKSAPLGVRLFADGVGGTAPVRVRADHLARARALLSPWLPPTVD